MAATSTVSGSSENSTTVRSGPGVLLRSALGTLAALSPKLAARLAGELFFTPRRAPLSDRGREALASAEASTIEAGSRRLALYRFGPDDPERPAVVLLHGWSARAAQVAHLAAPLLAEGYRVLAFDAPGHGESPGERTTLIEFAEALAEVVRQTGNVHAVIGHSMGGAAAVVAARRGMAVKRVVVIGAPALPGRVFHQLLRGLGVARTRRPAVTRALEQLHGFRFADLALPDLAAGMADHGIELLVVHDEDDLEVPASDGALLAGAAGAELYTTSGLGHRRVLRDPGVIMKLTRFVSGQPDDSPCRCSRCALETELFDRSLRDSHAQ